MQYNWKNKIVESKLKCETQRITKKDLKEEASEYTRKGLNATDKMNKIVHET